MPRGNRRDIPGELNAGGRYERKGAALTRRPGQSERGEGEGDAGCSGGAGERAAGSLGWPAGSGEGKAGGRTLGRRASRAERETVGRAGGSEWVAVKKGGGLGRSGWAGAGLSLVLGLFSISLFLILKQSNTFEFK